MSYFVRFSDRLVKDFTRVIETMAPKMWSDTGATYGDVRILAANYAGYGRYSARCHGDGTIEFPTGNRFSSIVIRDGVLDYRDARKETRYKACGTLLHELGHHTVNRARHKPWKHLRAGASTHTTPAWCWITARGWKAYHPDWPGTPELLALMVRRDKGDETHHGSIAHQLSQFSPLAKPPTLSDEVLGIEQHPTCQRCGVAVEHMRDGTKFCSPRCRVAAHRAQHREAA